ncbi:MAG: peptidylprolyl isomerase [Flavobacteriales bacterium]
MKITTGSKVSVIYTLRCDDSTGEIIEEATAHEPMEFTFGVDPMLEDFDNALKGLQAGEKFEVAIPCTRAYGEEKEELFIELPKSKFMADGEWDEESLIEDEIVSIESEEGQEMQGLIVEVKLTSVLVDFNHPLAGESLFFSGEVLKVN